MALFLSTITNKVDSKARVSVPASFRQALSKHGDGGLIAWPHHSLPVLDACDPSRVERLASSIDDPAFSGDALAFDVARIALADAKSLSLDFNGRMVMPEDFRRHADITDSVVFVGMGATFQIWSPSNYDNWRRQRLDQANEAGRQVSLHPIAPMVSRS